MYLDQSANAVFSGNLYIPSYIYHAGDPSNDTYFGFNGNDNFSVVTAGGYGLVIDSNRNVAFTGDVTMTQSSGNNILYINSSAGGNPVIYMEDTAVKWGQFVASGELYFKNETTNVVTLLLSGSNATFANDLTVSGGDITLGGTGRIQGIDTVSAGTDAANKDYVDTAVGAVPVGTVTSVSSSTTSQLTVSQSSPAPALSIVTAAVANGGTALATGNQIYDWGVAAFAPIVSGGYLPLSGGTMTGNIILENTQQVRFLTSANAVGLRLQTSGAGNSFIDNEVSDMYIRQEANGNDMIFQADDGFR